MGYAVVGHIEWVEFARVEHVPRPGEILETDDSWEEAAGGGAVAAVQLARLAGESTFFTAVGNDKLGRQSLEQLTAQGVRVQAVTRSAPQRRAFTHVDANGERTITVTGSRLAPAGDDRLAWSSLAGCDGVYFTAGDVSALRAARQARCLVATPRAGAVLQEAGVFVDALVLSGADATEARLPEGLAQPGLVVWTKGERGGSYLLRDGSQGAYGPAPLGGAIVDAYGCGDCFAAGLTYGLGSGRSPDEALALAARCGSACMTGRGPYEAQLRL